MPKQSPKPDRAREEPGPGRSTSEAAFNDRRRQIAERNEQHLERLASGEQPESTSNCSGAANATSRTQTVSDRTGNGLIYRPEAGLDRRRSPTTGPRADLTPQPPRR